MMWSIHSSQQEMRKRKASPLPLSILLLFIPMVRYYGTIDPSFLIGFIGAFLHTACLPIEYDTVDTTSTVV